MEGDDGALDAQRREMNNSSNAMKRESTDVALQRRVPRRTRTGHECGHDSGAMRCQVLPPSSDTVGQSDTHDRTRPNNEPNASLAAHRHLRFPEQMSASSPSQAKEQDDDTKPLWTYVTKLKSVGGGGNYEIKCNICDVTFNGSYTRVRAHLLKITGKGVRGCQKITNAKLIDLKNIDNEATLRVEKSKTKFVSLPLVSTQHQMDTNILGVDPKKRKTSTVESAFNFQAKETLDHEIARMFYSSGLPFHLARNPHSRKAFSYATNNYIGGYQPPGYNKLRTTLLQNEMRHVENLLQPIKNARSQKGAIDCSNEIKEKDSIAKHMREVIMEVGPSNIVQIVMDNATIFKAAGLIIKAQFPSIYWTPCVVHTLNLALKNICATKNTEKKKNNVVYQECSWITQIAEDAMFVKNFVMSHSMRLSILNSFNSLKLLSIAPARFASTIVMLKRFKQLKKGLQEMVINTLLDDNWWDKVDYILSFTSPIYDVLRRIDMKASSLHLVYEMWDLMIEKVKNAIYQYEGKEESEESTFYEDGREGFDDLDSLNDRGQMDPKAWWLIHGINAPILQKVALKLLAQPCSSSCCERNWKETKMWDVTVDDFGSLDDCDILEIASLSLDEPELEGVFFNDDDHLGVKGLRLWNS
ncbi:hypothetical protein JHK87_024367 [Glycine soja]|nr:hypothetical protein JHK87_024367 [Glycine soja]